MEKSERPEAFGVFKPVGHVVIAFPSEDRMRETAERLSREGIAPDDVLQYSAKEMVAQVDADLEKASPIASLGQEMNLVKAHRELALNGYGFLVVRARNDEESDRIATLAREAGAERAQYYGRFLIEELIEQPSDAHQVFESPARGLDIDTPERPNR